MTLVEYQSLLTALQVGKKLPAAIYFHTELLPSLPDSLRLLVEKLSGRLELSDEFNVIKFHRSQLKISFLAYPDFFEDPDDWVRNELEKTAEGERAASPGTSLAQGRGGVAKGLRPEVEDAEAQDLLTE